MRISPIEKAVRVLIHPYTVWLEYGIDSAPPRINDIWKALSSLVMQLGTLRVPVNYFNP